VEAEKKGNSGNPDVFGGFFTMFELLLEGF
jgi:hypothetical protein